MLALDAKESTGGLSAAEAARRLHTDGPNELPPARRHTTLVVAWEDVREPKFLLLMTAGTLVIRDGQRQPIPGREVVNGSCPVKIR